MHVEFAPGEAIPFGSCDLAGRDSTATVDVVKCRRIKLGRKSIYLRPGHTKKDVPREVKALHKLKHAHIAQLIGTYQRGRIFAALIHPVADMDLAHYLEEARDMDISDEVDTDVQQHPVYAHRKVLSELSLCLISALRYVHECGVKHMDIKPANILLKGCGPQEQWVYNIYLCDFGISQVLDFGDQSQADTFLGKPPTYASPEVAAGNAHGRASDVFSLGCVLV